MIATIRKYTSMGVLLLFWGWCMSVDNIRDGIGDVAKTGRANLVEFVEDFVDEIDLGSLEWS